MNLNQKVKNRFSISQILKDLLNRVRILEKGGGGGATLQQITDAGAITTNPISVEGVFNHTTTIYDNGVTIVEQDGKTLSFSDSSIVFDAPNSRNFKTTLIQDEAALNNDIIVQLPRTSGKIALISMFPTVAQNYADDTFATAGGVAIGGLYHTNGVVKINLGIA